MLSTTCYWILVIIIVPGIIGGGVTWISNRILDINFHKTARAQRWEFSPYDRFHIIEGRIPWQPIIIGIVERISFSIITALAPQYLATPILGWLGIKMATGWNRLQGPEVWRRMLAFNALLNGLLSILIGIIGGLIIVNQEMFLKLCIVDFICVQHALYSLIIIGLLSTVGLLWFIKYLIEKDDSPG